MTSKKDVRPSQATPPVDIPFTVYFPQELLDEAATAALEMIGPFPDGTPIPQGYEAISSILRDYLRRVVVERRRDIALRAQRAAEQAAQEEAETLLASLDRLRIEPIVP